MIVSMALEINTTIGECIISGDMKLVRIPAGEVFDSRSMEDAYPSHGEMARNVNTLCTTEMGLQLRQVDAQGTSSETILVKPRVAVSLLLGEVMDG